MNKLQKMIKRSKARYIFGMMAIIGFIMILGTVGAIDGESITLTRAIIQGGISLAIFSVGVFPFMGVDYDG